MSVVTRFAPSPTGDLHPGHAYAAAFAHAAARRAGGRFLVRVEDIDSSRCRDEFIERNLDDLRWLGLSWEEPVVRQSQRMALYRAALERLQALGVAYPCFCTRRTISREIAAAAGAPHVADHAPVYPGTCRNLPGGERHRRMVAGEPYAVRLDAERAAGATGELFWTDRDRGRQPVILRHLGDVVIARKEMPVSYHLAVVVDDARQGVTLVTRGEDLIPATPLHRALYALLDLPPPLWQHHALVRDAGGRRLAKRTGALTIQGLRGQGCTPRQVLALAGAVRLSAAGEVDATNS